MNLELEINQLSTQLIKRRLSICTAESCTGGLIAKLFTDKSGSSDWFDCAFISYTNAAKQLMLGVTKSTLESSGAVSQPTVIEMAEGAINKSNSKVSIAISGVAGPGGGTKEKPVGMVWISWAGKHYETETQCYYFDGDRDSIRYQAARAAIKGVIKYIVKNA
ncbi:MAG: damage-inducible protein CinA [Gammaproteobacteria bacterium]|nr:MAG: damage-inducible protein CinA [Gammaproteobacteria bacterium]